MQVRPLIMAVATAALAASALPAAAATEQGRSAVSYSDLDLSGEAGRSELSKRFDQAAKDMCGVTEADTKLSGKKRYCYESNSKGMQARVASILSQHKEGKGG